jgi:tRNA (guanine37-N1)-methyltransferase
MAARSWSTGSVTGSASSASHNAPGDQRRVRFDCITLFPEMFRAVTESGITRRALEDGRWMLQAWNPRDFTTDNHRTIDDRPYGGGPGMVMMAGPLAQAVEAARRHEQSMPARVVYLSPQGRALTHARVIELAREDRLILLCGRYEGVVSWRRWC